MISFTDTSTRQLFYNAHILPHIDYCSTVWDGCSEANSKRLNSLHRRAAKLILPNRSDSADERMKSLNMLPLRKHFLLNKGAFMRKIQSSAAPQYLSDLFSPAASPYKTARNSLFIPRPRLDILKTSISYSGAHIWNSLPEHVKQTSSQVTFRARLFRHLNNTS